MTSVERAFWERFTGTHPQPPTALDRQQFAVAESILQSKQRRATVEKARAAESGFPPEGLTDEALLWAYVFKMREKYQNLLKEGKTETSVSIKNLFSQLAVDRRYVAEPLSDAQAQLKNAWKIAYLQRLRKEKTDESYINAYLQAWNLSPAEVFSGTNQP